MSLHQALAAGWAEALASGAPQFFGAAMLFLLPLGFLAKRRPKPKPRHLRLVQASNAIHGRRK